MTEAKKIAESLTTIMENPIVNAILDRSKNLNEVMTEVQGWWNYDLFTRKPSPAYDQYGIFKGTDLDLACFLYSLSGRGAVINIPTYKTHSQTRIREDQELRSKDNRNGELIGVGANKDFFSFNITIIDQNVVGEDTVGDFRTFSLTDKTGLWYDGWKSIQFNPTLKENRFITENQLWSGNRIVFKNFIHPNRWTSFFGHHYVITKLLIDRLVDEAAFLNSETKRLQAAGIVYPEGKGPKSYSYEYGNSESKKFVAFETMIYMPKTQISGDYTLIEATQDNLVWAYETRKKYNAVISRLRFMTRASEYAHYINPERFPHWLQNVKWENDFVIPGKKNKWQRLKLFQPKVGEHSVSILKRIYEKSARVGTDD